MSLIPEVVSINQNFLLFDPNRTTTKPAKSLEAFKRKFGPDFYIPDYRSEVSLRIPQQNMLLLIPFSLVLLGSITCKGQAITPFNPEEGYQVTKEDLDFSSRIKKIQDNIEALRTDINFNKASHWLNIGCKQRQEELDKLGLIYPNPDNKYGWLSDNPSHPLLNRLYLQIIVPPGEDNNFYPILHFESPVDRNALNIGEISFSHFYPTETGPLPTYADLTSRIFTHKMHVFAGLALYLPSDYEKIRIVEGRFVLRENKTNPSGNIPQVFRDAFTNEDFNEEE